MKKKVIMIVIGLLMIIFVFIFVFLNKNNNKALLVMSCDSDNSWSMNLEDEKYIYMGMIELYRKGKKIAYVEGEEKKCYVYTLKGYDDYDFLIVQRRLFIEVTFALYAKNDIQSIPREFLNYPLTDSTRTIAYNGIKYYFFSSTPEEFIIDRFIGRVEEEDDDVTVYDIPPIPTAVLDLYEIPNIDSKEWIAARDVSSKEAYRIYYSEEEHVEFIPLEYLIYRMEYPGSEYYGNYENKVNAN